MKHRISSKDGDCNCELLVSHNEAEIGSNGSVTMITRAICCVWHMCHHRIYTSLWQSDARVLGMVSWTIFGDKVDLGFRPRTPNSSCQTLVLYQYCCHLSVRMDELTGADVDAGGYDLIVTFEHVAVWTMNECRAAPRSQTGNEHQSLANDKAQRDCANIGLIKDKSKVTGHTRYTGTRSRLCKGCSTHTHTHTYTRTRPDAQTLFVVIVRDI